MPLISSGPSCIVLSIPGAYRCVSGREAGHRAFAIACGPMDPTAALAFIASNHRAVLATTRADGSPQLSLVAAGVDGDTVVVVHPRDRHEDQEPAPSSPGLAHRVHRQLLRGLGPGRGPGRGRLAPRGHGRARGLLPRRSRASIPTGTTTAPPWSESGGSCCGSPSSGPGPTAPADRRQP